ncbi:hypothetical protein [Micromonospora endophytica]|nr:hypothetical protein [Micromonospora endophytica]
MSAQRLGRLFGSVMLVLSLVIASGAAAELEVRTSGIDWASSTLP